MNFLKYISFLVFSTFFLVLLSKSLVGQTYTIPFAEKQPAWVFPLWFTNGDGQKDTVYLAYDSNASDFVVDTVFGEYTIDPSPGVFQIRLGLENRKVHASNDISYSTFLLIYNRIEPFTISFDARMLSSDSLPGIPSELIPKVWGGFGGSGLIEDCPTIDFDGFFVALTDTTIDGYPGNSIENDFCSRDSIIKIEALTGLTTIGLAEWNPSTGLYPSSNQSNVFADTWVSQGELLLSINSTESVTLKLYSISGVLLYERTHVPGVYTYAEELKSQLGNYNGLVLAHLVQQDKKVTKKLFFP